MDTDGNGHTLPVSIRSAILEYSAFNPNPSVAYPKTVANPSGGGPASHSIGIQIGDPVTGGSSQSTIQDVTVVGFGTCLKGRARDLTVEDCRLDCATALDLKTPDVPFISNVRNERLLTGPQG